MRGLIAKNSARACRLGVGAKRVFCLLGIFLSLSFSQASGCQKGEGGGQRAGTSFTLLNWNVQNLFNGKSEGGEYPDYNPENGQWDRSLFLFRAHRVKDVLEAATPGGPDVFVFQEVENLGTVKTLNQEILGADFGYETEVFSPQEDVVPNVGLLSRFPLYGKKSVRALPVGSYKGRDLRAILEVTLDVRGTPLTLLIVHWKSKGGGARKTEPSRVHASKVVADLLRERLTEDPSAYAVVLGDFNANWDEQRRIGKNNYKTALLPDSQSGFPQDWSDVLFLTGERDKVGLRDSRVILYTPWPNYPGKGSYAYEKDPKKPSIWQTIDNVLLTRGFFQESLIAFESFRVTQEDFLLDKNGFPRGWELPRRRGSQRGGLGYSDHLPLLVTFTLR